MIYYVCTLWFCIIWSDGDTVFVRSNSEKGTDHLPSLLSCPLGLKLAQKKYPKFKTIIQEESPEGELIMTMVFESAETPYKIWAEPSRWVRAEREGDGEVPWMENVCGGWLENEEEREEERRKKKEIDVLLISLLRDKYIEYCGRYDTYHISALLWGVRENEMESGRMTITNIICAKH
jgi:hypothetical protein